MIKSNPQVSRVELSVQLGLHKSSVQRRLDSLVKEGRLRHIGPTNGGSWEVIE
ncbi:MAG: helix-turn-helix domain-containing protein [Muribaculaceae bacterium]